MDELGIPLAKIGKTQMKDVMRSGKEMCNEYFRTCTVLQLLRPENVYCSDIGDRSPYHIQDLYRKDEMWWNRHFIAQVAGCPLRCWYCYVDNLKQDKRATVGFILTYYQYFKQFNPDVHVLHLMGGDPGLYCHMWGLLRDEMDAQGYEDDILMTNVVLVEAAVAKVRPWEHIPPRTIVNACLKGTNIKNFEENTGTTMFAHAIHELFYYLEHPQVFFSMIEYDAADLDYFVDLIGKGKLDLLSVKPYEVVKKRLAGGLND